MNRYKNAHGPERHGRLQQPHLGSQVVDPPLKGLLRVQFGLDLRSNLFVEPHGRYVQLWGLVQHHISTDEVGVVPTLLLDHYLPKCQHCMVFRVFWVCSQRPKALRLTWVVVDCLSTYLFVSKISYGHCEIKLLIVLNALLYKNCILRMTQYVANLKDFLTLLQRPEVLRRNAQVWTSASWRNDLHATLHTARR